MKKTKFNKKELSLFSEIIDSRIKDEKGQLKSVSKILKDQKKFKASADLKDDSDVSIIRNAEMLKSMKRKTENKLKDLESAKQRIKNKTYGICRKTGKMISKDRLLVMPEATLRIKKKKKS